ncbi:OLC1v1020291C1 [Oldenlandia corymbosa var. corymbosa]|uniref:OLC1v1020291C1 n=1 Tax=Oldenlandia corymbosa var. corymbosa TaxID=529605 RepID=A0AAV1EG75_OLDCO|nr:OLC1v1020291C1 [Oldenlandia corymbosa var. corymbosa]
MDFWGLNDRHCFCVLFEASGDSDGHSNSLEDSESLMWLNTHGGALPIANAQDDDAESSSCDDYGYMLMTDSHMSNEFKYQSFGTNSEDDDVEDGAISSGMLVEGSSMRNNREVDEADHIGDMLFWMMCLEGGYPY